MLMIRGTIDLTAVQTPNLATCVVAESVVPVYNNNWYEGDVYINRQCGRALINNFLFASVSFALGLVLYSTYVICNCCLL